MTRKPPPNQLDLFGPTSAAPQPRLTPEASAHGQPLPVPVMPALLPPRVVELAQRLPANVLLGTSSWSFPGWKGIVYADSYSESDLARYGLKAYAAHPLLRTVGLDRTYYAPLPETDAAAYAQQLPAGFPMVIKVWEEITLPVFPRHPRYGERAGRRSEHFLDADTLTDVFLRPLQEAFLPHCGPLVLEFSPMAPSSYGSAEAFLRRLDGFLAALPKEFRFAVELRNAELMTREYAAVLRRHGAAHVYNRWTRTPSLERQRALVGDPWTEWTVIRLLLPEGGTYESLSAQCAPFDRVVAVDEAMRQQVVELTVDSLRRGQRVHVLVNNKAEGSAPLTCLALAERMVDALSAERLT